MAGADVLDVVGAQTGTTSAMSMATMAGVRHDLANLLGAILIECDLLRATALPDAACVEVDVIVELVQRAIGVSQRLDALARPAATERLDVCALVSGMASMLDRLVGSGVDVEIAVATGLAAVDGDRVELERALFNLAINAAEAMAGRGRLMIRTCGSADGGVTIELTDDGPGIDPALCAHLVDRTLAPPARGARGHGLAVVARAVALHRGAVRVERPAEGGSRFVIELPAAVGEPARDRPRARGSSPAP